MKSAKADLINKVNAAIIEFEKKTGYKVESIETEDLDGNKTLVVITD